MEDVTGLGLYVGRLLIQNGADTAQVQGLVTRTVSAFGAEAHLVVTYSALLLTVIVSGRSYTKVGNRIPAMNVNLATVTSVNRLVEEVEAGRRTVAEARRALEEYERRPLLYRRWRVAMAMGLTAASLARLLGGDWVTCAVVWLAGTVGTWTRQELSRRAFNLFFIPFAVALVSGVLGGVADVFGWSNLPALCLIAPGMILVPGVPLVNGVQDMIRNHMSMGLARLGLGVLVTVAIGAGLFGAALVTGARIPVGFELQSLSVAEDALFSGLAALGFVFLFNVPARLGWACVACGIASHSTRTLGVQLGLHLVAGSWVGALLAGFLAQAFARRLKAPAVAFAFPGVVSMIPGAFAFQATMGWIQIVAAGAAAPVSLLSKTLALTASCLMIVTAIAVGIAAPLIVLRKDTSPR